MDKKEMNWGSWEEILEKYIEPSAWSNIKWNSPFTKQTKKAENTQPVNDFKPSKQALTQTPVVQNLQTETVRDFLIRRKHSTKLLDDFDSKIWSKVKVTDKDKYKDFLLKMAALESGFVVNSVHEDGKDKTKDALGLYQILDKFIKHYTNDPNMTREKFLKDPVIQTEAAVRIAKENFRIISSDKNKEYLEDIAKQGFDVWDAMAAGWLAGANGSIASWRKAKETGDFISDKNGTDTNERMLAHKQLTI